MKEILEKRYFKILIIILLIFFVSFMGYLIGYAYISGGILGALRLETWQNFIYELRNIFS